LLDDDAEDVALPVDFEGLEVAAWAIAALPITTLAESAIAIAARFTFCRM
jgi:hypothetical protein